MLSPILARVLCALRFLSLIPVQDEARVLSAFDKAFTPPPKGKATINEKAAALSATAGIDSAKLAELLVDAWTAVAGEQTEVDNQLETAMDKDLNAQFLRQLAEENGGEFKQF